MFPAVRPSAGVFGETVAHDGLPAGIPVAGIAGDQQAALFGQGALAPGGAKNTYGTGCFLLLNTGPTPVASDAGLLTTVAWALPRRGRRAGRLAYALEGAVFVAGAAVQWLRDGLGLIKTAAETEPLARSVPDTGGVYLVPAFVGLGRALLGHVRARRPGGADARHDPRPRRAGDARGDRLPDARRARGDGRGGRPRPRRSSGSTAARRRTTSSVSSRRTCSACPSCGPGCARRRALGAAYLAGLGAGVWPGPEALQGLWQLDRAFEPTMPAARRDALYAGWRRAVDRARGWARDET